MKILHKKRQKLIFDQTFINNLYRWTTYEVDYDLLKFNYFLTIWNISSICICYKEVWADDTQSNKIPTVLTWNIRQLSIWI